MTSSLLGKYAIIATCYGSLRKLLHIVDAHTQRYDINVQKTIEVPLLTVDKIGVVAASAAMSVYMAPFWLCKDLRKLEVSLCGLEKEYYISKKTPYHALDYVFY